MSALHVHHQFEVEHLGPTEPGYDQIRKHFTNASGSPTFTGICLTVPEAVELSERRFLVARYCLAQALDGQTCIATNFGPINIDTFFQGTTLSGYEQLHLLAHLVLANLDGLTDQPNVHDRLFEDKHGTVLVFSADFPENRFRERVAELQTDLHALLSGKITGRIAKAVFG